MSDLRNYSRDFIAEFIELYRNHPSLWKVKAKEYYDRNKKNAAYQVLVEKLHEAVPNATKDTVIKKINTIRGCFRKEYKKVKASMKSGSTGTDNVYVPHLWYYEMLLFLQDQETARSSVSNMESGKNVENQNEDEEMVENHVDDQEFFLQSPIQAAASASADETSQSSPSTETASASSATSETHRTAFRGKRKQRLIDNSDEILNAVDEKLRNYSNEDEFSIIGKNVATKLRRLPKEMRIYTEKLINDVLFQAELGNINKYTCINTHEDTTTCTKYEY